MTERILPNWIPVVLLLASGCANQPGAETGSPADDSIDSAFTATCEMIVDELAAFGIVASVEKSEDACLIEGAVATEMLETDIDPLQNLRESMAASGWVEDIEWAADGPGTSSFRLESSVQFCQFSGGAPAWIDDDDGIRQSDEYFVEVACGRSR